MNESKHFCPHIVNNIDFILSTLSISLIVKKCTTVKVVIYAGAYAFSMFKQYALV